MKQHFLTEDMNEQQAAAITTGAGPVLVLAGPGSGKTSVLTRRIAWLIREQRIPEDIIASWRSRLQIRLRMKCARELRLFWVAISTACKLALFTASLRDCCGEKLSEKVLGYRPDWNILSANKQYWVIRRILERIAYKDTSFSPTKCAQGDFSGQELHGLA